MPLKKFKLVPIKLFENITNENLNIPKKDINETQINDQNMENPNRNVREIQEVFQNSESNLSTPDFKFKKNVTEAGAVDQPIFLPDANTLPQFTKAANVKKSFDKLTDILNSKDLTEDMKLKLYNLFRDKYDRTRGERNDYRDSDEDMDEDGNYLPLMDEKNYFVLQKILARLPRGEKLNLATSIGDVLINTPNHISWNRDGKFMRPKVDEDVMMLEDFIKILIYKKKGSNNQIRMTIKIIKPFFNKIQRYVRNESVKETMRNLQLKSRPSKYERFY